MLFIKAKENAPEIPPYISLSPCPPRPLSLSFLQGSEVKQIMEIDRSSVLNWAYCSREKSVEELRNRLFCISLELENVKAAAQEELRRREDQLVELRGLLEMTLRERDEAVEKYQKVLLENLLLQQQMVAARPISGVSRAGDKPWRVEKDKDSSNTFNGGISSSDCDDSIVSSPLVDLIQPPPCKSLTRSLDSLLAPEKPLPEKGKLLQAMMKAGPLLQTLLLAGPLPQWQHPPPLLESSEIPPVKIPSLPPPPSPTPLFLQDSILIKASSSSSSGSTVTSCGRVCSKRGHSEGLLDFPNETKYQRVALP